MKATRFLLFILASILSIGTGWAGNWGSNKTYYYRGVAKTGDATKGSVYVSTESTRPSDGFVAEKNTDTENSWYSYTYYTPKYKRVNSSATASATVYFFAQPVEGYKFDYWYNENDESDKRYGEDVSVTFDISSTDDNNPTTVTYIAHFTAIEKLKVASQDGGNATMEKTGDNLYKLTAHNRYDYVFDGWYEGSTKISLDNPLTVDTKDFTETKTYTAHWKEKSVTYYRLRNQNNKYIKIVGNQGESLTHKDGKTDIFDGFKLNGTIEFVSQEEAKADLGTILKVTHGNYASGAYTTFDIEAQGQSLTDMLSANIKSLGDLGLTTPFSLTWDGIDKYRIKNSEQGYYIQSVGNDAEGYFVGDSYANANKDVWYFEPVDEIPISADIDATREGKTKYYTTLYTSFPYTCQEGVKAYIVSEVAEETGIVGISTLDGQVPAFTPVILECSSNNPADNIIKPLNEEVGSVSGNKLQGAINLYTNSDQPTTLQTVAYGENTRIIKKYTATTPAVVTFSHPSESGYVASNTCYLESNLAENQLISTLYDPTLDIYGASGRVQENATGDDFADYCKTNKNAMALMDEIYECVAASVPNVIVKHNNDTYDCGNFVLTDKVDWNSPVSFTAKSGSYKRSNVGGLNSVCMPFPIAQSDLPEGSIIYTLNSIDTENDEADFSAVSSVAAGTPCLIQCADDAELWDFLLSNASVTPEIASVTMQGSYTKKTLGTGYWKVNSDGTKLTNTTASSTITPFRSYIAVPEGMPAKALKIIFTTPTGIKNYDKVLTNDAAFYGIDGRETNTLRKGINIVRNADGSTRKILK